MSTYISPSLRLFIAQRADSRCEYCLLREVYAAYPHEPDHIVPLQHGGDTADHNLACAGFYCNRNKGPNIGSFDPLTGKLTLFFNPRIHNWDEHFILRGAVIEPLTPEARVTVKILRLNDEERLIERQRLLALGVYP